MAPGVRTADVLPFAAAATIFALVTVTPRLACAQQLQCTDDPSGALQAAIGMDCTAALAAIPQPNPCTFSLTAWLHRDIIVSDICPVSC
eukprot:SAG31_NODE_22954_length_514_cov_1.000000_2_plen_88_part_01